MTQTPMMRQYQEIKAQYPGALLLFRLGDFYEMFYDDAVLASRLLGLTLTSRSKGEKAVPMAGVPYHSVHAYVKRLIQAGYKVALCDQIEDPREAQGLVDRDVTRVITPGTVTEDALLESKDHNYLAALLLEGDAAGLSWVDLSTGQFHAEDLPAAHLGDELTRLNPSRAAPAREPGLRRRRPPGTLPARDRRDDHAAARLGLRARHRAEDALRAFPRAVARRLRLRRRSAPRSRAAGATLQYLQETQKISLGHIRRLARMSDSDRVVLDRSTQLSLELTRTLREGAAQGIAAGRARPHADADGRPAAEGVARRPAAADSRRSPRGRTASRNSSRTARCGRRPARRLNEVYDIERLTARVATARRERARPAGAAALARAAARAEGAPAAPRGTARARAPSASGSTRWTRRARSSAPPSPPTRRRS